MKNYHEDNILEGDATNSQKVSEVLAGHQINLVHCDPPYCLLTRRRKKGDKRDPHKRKKIDHESVRRFESVKDFRVFTGKWLDALWPHLAPDAHFIIWTNLLGRETTTQEMQKRQYYLHGEYQWARYSKEKSGKGEKWLRLYEVALIFGPSPFITPKLDEPIPPRFFISGPHLTDLEKEQEGIEHPNHKPFAPLLPLISYYSKQGDTLFDPFAGSGSLPRAAALMKRKSYALELRPQWATLAKQRLLSLS